MVSALADNNLLLLMSDVAIFKFTLPLDCKVPLLLMVSAVIVPVPEALLAKLKVPLFVKVPTTLKLLALVPPCIPPALVKAVVVKSSLSPSTTPPALLFKLTALPLISKVFAASLPA